MKLIFFFLVMGNTLALAQHVGISPDSSKLVFPNNVAVSVKPMREGKRFVMDATALRILLVQCNYLYNRIDQSSENVELYKRERIYQDSVIRLLKKELTLSQERVEVHKEAYAQLKLVSADYNKQSGSMLAELSNSQRKDRKNKRRSFFRGLAFGLASGVAVAIFIVQQD
jgi:hypothetical protein